MVLYKNRYLCPNIFRKIEVKYKKYAWTNEFNSVPCIGIPVTTLLWTDLGINGEIYNLHHTGSTQSLYNA